MVRKFYKAQVFVLFLMHFYASGMAFPRMKLIQPSNRPVPIRICTRHGSSTTLYLSAKQEETYEGWVKAYYEFSYPDENRSQIENFAGI